MGARPLRRKHYFQGLENFCEQNSLTTTYIKVYVNLMLVGLGRGIKRSLPDANEQALRLDDTEHSVKEQNGASKIDDVEANGPDQFVHRELLCLDHGALPLTCMSHGDLFSVLGRDFTRGLEGLAENKKNNPILLPVPSPRSVNGPGRAF
jgi:hypothetical protein